MSNKLSRAIENFIKPSPHKIIAHKPFIRIQYRFLKLKANVSKNKKLYAIPYSKYSGVCIGKTQQKLCDRMKIHKYTKIQTHDIYQAHIHSRRHKNIISRKKTREFIDMIQIKKIRTSSMT